MRMELKATKIYARLSSGDKVIVNDRGQESTIDDVINSSDRPSNAGGRYLANKRYVTKMCFPLMHETIERHLTGACKEWRDSSSDESKKSLKYSFHSIYEEWRGPLKRRHTHVYALDIEIDFEGMTGYKNP